MSANTEEMGLFLAHIFGPFLFLFGLWFVLYKKNVSKVFQSLKNTPSVFFLSGMLNLLIAFFILNGYREWSFHPLVLLTLFGWGLLIRGLGVFFMPQAVMKFLLPEHAVWRWMGLIPLFWGLALTLAS